MIKNKVLLPLLTVNTFSLIGFATFANDPDYLKMFPWAEPLFEISYPLFSRLQILVSAVAMFIILSRHCSKLWLNSFFAISLTSLASELMGTSFGIPFGAYSYSALLGFKILNKVPALIPLSWFYMSLASYDLVRIQLNSRHSFSLLRVVFASFLLLSWDLVLDPAMSHLTPFWLWENPGGFFGMPTSNLIGWFVTGLCLMLWLELFQASHWLDNLPKSFTKQFYLANLMLPLGMCLISQLWFPVLLTLLFLCFFIVRWPVFFQLLRRKKGSLA